jgi:hypothetical protein
MRGETSYQENREATGLVASETARAVFQPFLHADLSVILNPEDGALSEYNYVEVGHGSVGCSSYVLDIFSYI